MPKLELQENPSGDQRTVAVIADFFDLPPSQIIEKAKPILPKGTDISLETKVDRFLIEKALSYGKQKGERWAAASLGLTLDTLQQCCGHEALTDTPLPFGVLPTKKRQHSGLDDRKIFHLDQLSEWATMLIESHQGRAVTFSSVTNKAIRLRDALKEAGIDAKLQFCSFESKHLSELRLSDSDEGARAVASVLCLVTGEPIWEGNGCWLENGKPLSLKPDFVSYEAFQKVILIGEFQGVLWFLTMNRSKNRQLPEAFFFRFLK